MKKILVLLILITSVFILQAQKYTISGYVMSDNTGEKLAGATVFDKNMTHLGTSSNTYGFYSITIPAMEVNLIASYVGYDAQIFSFKLTKDTVINFELKSATDIEVVEVTGVKTEAEKTQMGRIDVPMSTIKNMPMLMGEVDIMKTIQLLPGVQSGTEGTSGIYVRGGGPDQNLILIDGVPVYNANHLFGFFSVFNSDAISDVSLIKGGFPARYGGRLSSVIDIKMKEGNSKKFTGAASIGLISSKLMIEGPIIKDKTSFILSARRTYIDVLSWPIQAIAMASYEGESGRFGYYFWDINAKINHKFSEKDRLFLSAYTGKDKAYSNMKEEWGNSEEKYKSSINWGNLTSAVRWNHIITPKLFCNTTLTYSKYKFAAEFSEEDTDYSTNNFSEDAFKYFSGIEDYAAKFDFDYMPSPNHNIKFGASYTYHIFKPGISAYKSNYTGEASIDTTFGNSEIYSNETAFFFEDEIKLTNSIKANLGVHYSSFFVKDTMFHSVEPRVSTRFLITPSFSIKAAYTQMTQYLHLLTNTTIGMPTDLWLPVTKKVLPQQSKQYALGAAYSFGSSYDISIDGYYKDMTNLIEYKEGASFFSSMEEGNSNWEEQIEIDGKGWSYGFEVLIKKNRGNTTGWIGYTLSFTDRQFLNISNGKIFPYAYDRRHDIGIVIVHKFNEKVDMGLTWVYGTGNACTLALETYSGLSNDDVGYYYDNTINHIDSRNNYRMPAYHRLDLSINLRKEKKYGKRTWSFGAYNVYNRKNPFFLMFSNDDYGNKVLKQISLFPLIPSVAYKYEF